MQEKASLCLSSCMQHPQPNPRDSTQTCLSSAASSPGQFLLAAVTTHNELLSGYFYHTHFGHRQNDRQLNLLQKPSALCLAVVCGKDPVHTCQATLEGFTPLPTCSKGLFPPEAVEKTAQVCKSTQCPADPAELTAPGGLSGVCSQPGLCSAW